MEKRQKVTAEFKREAARLLQRSAKAAAVVARELGIPPRKATQRAGLSLTRGAREERGSILIDLSEKSEGSTLTPVFGFFLQFNRTSRQKCGRWLPLPRRRRRRRQHFA